MLIAITRDVSPAIGQCELTYLDRVEIDYALACTQHEHYRQALAGLGCRVVSLPAQADLPDSVFVEDVALVLDEAAILTRPGAASRRSEVELMAPILAQYRPLARIEPPSTLDGGDILRLGKTIYVGLSGRSSAEAIRQLRELTAPFGYAVTAVPVTGCLHLKSAVTQVAPDTLLVNPGWINTFDFSRWRVLKVDPAEPGAANALLVGTGLIYPACFPRTARRLAQHGLAPTLVDVGELQKAEGAVTCCSLVFAG